VNLGASRHGNAVRIFLVAPLDKPTLLDRLRGRKPISNVSDLMLICRETHAMLSAISGVSAIRWSFERFNGETSGFATPDELPWNHS
jgi:hypothetical protein